MAWIIFGAILVLSPFILSFLLAAIEAYQYEDWEFFVPVFWTVIILIGIVFIVVGVSTLDEV